MKNYEVLVAEQVLAQVSQEKFPIGVGIKIRRISKTIGEYSKEIEIERNALLEKFAKRDKDGEMIYLNDEKTQVNVERPAFDIALNEFLNLEADIVIDRPIKASELKDVEMQPSVLIALSEIIVEDE